MISKEEFTTLASTNPDGDTLLTGAFGPGQAHAKVELFKRPVKLLGCLPHTLMHWNLRHVCHIQSCGTVMTSVLMASTKSTLLEDAVSVLMERVVDSVNRQIVHNDETVFVLTVEDDTTRKRIVYLVTRRGWGNNQILKMDVPAEGAEDYLSTFYEETFSQISLAPGLGAFYLRDMRQQLDERCPLPSGWAVLPGVIEGKLTPRLVVKIAAYHHGWFGITAFLDEDMVMTSSLRKDDTIDAVEKTIPAMIEVKLAPENSLLQIKVSRMLGMQAQAQVLGSDLMTLVEETKRLPPWAKDALAVGLGASVSAIEQENDHHRNTILQNEIAAQKMRDILKEAPWAI